MQNKADPPKTEGFTQHPAQSREVSCPVLLTPIPPGWIFSPTLLQSGDVPSG